MITIEFINNIIKKRFLIVLVFLILFFIYSIIILFKLEIIDNKKYKELLSIKTSKAYTAKVGERGKIYDRNGNLLVGNKEINTVVYLKEPNVSIEKEIELAKIISENIDLDYSKVSIDVLKKFYLIKNEEILEEKISQKIRNKYKNREITKEEYITFLYELIDVKELENLTEEEKKQAYVYFLMNKGYRNAYKTIKGKDVSEKEYNYIIQNKDDLRGFDISVKYERYYPYGLTFRSYLGNVGPIPEEEIENMLEKGYNMDDIVGVSYLEKQYEEYLRGQNETYTLDASGKRTTITEAKPGKDIMLSIDINLQKEIETLVLENVKKAKSQPNTTYYNRSYVIISNPSNGEILASVGKGIIKTLNEYEEVDYLTDLTTVSVTPGSIVKGASHLVGYVTGAIDFGYTVNDSCIKIKNTPKKCSWKKLGKIDDLEALKYSSNYYQFLIAIKVGKGLYTYNGPLTLDAEGFKIYRNIYNQFGLGVLTKIDLPYESIGYIGNDKNTGSILDFPIGQYDTYTPMQLLQYINTLGMDGKRIAPHFLKAIYEPSEKELTNLISEYKVTELNTVDVNPEYIKRVQTGLKMVMERGGTGSGYIDLNYNPIGKTGTAQSFIDTNHDGIIDTETITTTFGGYAPYENPTFSMIVISPNVSSRKTSYISSVNKKISKLVSDLYFKNYN